MMSDSMPTYPDPEPEDEASARHCEIKIDGLPGQLPPGTYRMTFLGMEYRPGARPVLRFGYAGHEDDTHGLTPDEQAILERQMAVTRQSAAEAEGWLPRREEERNQWPIMDLSQPPDLYMGTPVGTVEVLNVSKVARVIAELLRRGLISEADIGLPLAPRTDEGWGQQVEGWLRS